MADEDTKEEERIMRSISRKPGPAPKSARPVSMVVQPVRDTTTTSIQPPNASSVTSQQPKLAAPPQVVTSVTPRGTSTVAPTTSNKDQPSRSVSTPSGAYIPRVSSPPQFGNSANTTSPIDIEQLREKKRTLLGTVVTARRDLEEVRAEIAKLRHRETELINLMEKRENAIHQLTTQIEQLEHAELTDKLTTEEHKKRIDEEKARKVREENERRRKEEAEEERKRKEAEEEKRRKMVVNSPSYVGSTAEVKVSIPETVIETPALRPVLNDVNEDDFEAEEARLMRAMSRQKPTANPTNRGSAYVKPPPVQTQAAPVVVPKSVAEPHWKENERAKEIERNQRLAEENRKKEEARRAEQERQAQTIIEDKSHLSSLQNRDGVMHTFHSPPVYTITDIFICGDFTDWKEVALDTDAPSKNFQYPITLPVSKGVHFYRFKVGDKWEVNKNNPTGVSPQGDVMNKVDIS